MNKLGKIFQGEHKSFRIFFAVATLAFVVIWLVGPGNTWVHWIKAGIELKHQQKQIEYYDQEIIRLDNRIDMLKTDRDTLEKFAREQFHFTAPGEDVYIVEKD